MKQFGIRFWFANLIVILSFIVIAVSILGHIFAPLNETIKDLFPVLTIIGSVGALAFALLEAMLLYRSWKASVTSDEE